MGNFLVVLKFHRLFLKLNSSIYNILSQLVREANNAHGKLVKVTPNFFHYEISATKRSRKHCSSRHHSWKLLFIVALFMKASALFISASFTNNRVFACIIFLSLYKRLRTHTHFLKCMINKHVLINLVSLNKNFSPC